MFMAHLVPDIKPSLDDATAQEFAEALMQLLETRPLDEVRVMDIIERAGYSRKTFYRHFDDKTHLLNWALYAQYRSHLTEGPGRGRSLRALAEVAAANPAFFAAAIRENASASSPGNYFSRLMFAGIYTSMADELYARLADDAEVDVCIGATCELLRGRMLAWLDGGHAGDVEWFLASTNAMMEAMRDMLTGDISETSGLPG